MTFFFKQGQKQILILTHRYTLPTVRIPTYTNVKCRSYPHICISS